MYRTHIVLYQFYREVAILVGLYACSSHSIQIHTYHCISYLHLTFPDWTTTKQTDRQETDTISLLYSYYTTGDISTGYVVYEDRLGKVNKGGLPPFSEKKYIYVETIPLASTVLHSLKVKECLNNTAQYALLQFVSSNNLNCVHPMQEVQQCKTVGNIFSQPDHKKREGWGSYFMLIPSHITSILAVNKNSPSTLLCNLLTEIEIYEA